jgi:hypothetical protein
MKMVVEIDLDNAAFDGDQFPGEVGVILFRIADQISRRVRAKPHFPHPDDGVSITAMVTAVMDSNGNTIGSWSILEDEES